MQTALPEYIGRAMDGAILLPGPIHETLASGVIVSLSQYIGQSVVPEVHTLALFARQLCI